MVKETKGTLVTILLAQPTTQSPNPIRAHYLEFDGCRRLFQIPFPSILPSLALLCNTVESTTAICVVSLSCLHLCTLIDSYWDDFTLDQTLPGRAGAAGVKFKISLALPVRFFPPMWCELSTLPFNSGLGRSDHQLR